MEQRWGLPLIAWPSRLRPNYWDLVALPLVLGAARADRLGRHGDERALSASARRCRSASIRGSCRNTRCARCCAWAAALVASLVFSLAYAALAAKSRQAEKILIPVLDILQSVPILGFLSITVTGFIALFPGQPARRRMRRDLRDLHLAGLEHDVQPVPVAAHRAARADRGGADVPPVALAAASGGSKCRTRMPHARLEHDDVGVGRLVLRRRLRGDHRLRPDDHAARHRLLHRDRDRPARPRARSATPSWSCSSSSCSTTSCCSGRCSPGRSKFKVEAIGGTRTSPPWFLIMLQRARLFDLVQSARAGDQPRRRAARIGALARAAPARAPSAPAPPLGSTALFDAPCWRSAALRARLDRRLHPGRASARREIGWVFVLGPDHRAAGAGADRARLADLGADRRLDRAAPAHRRPGPADRAVPRRLSGQSVLSGGGRADPATSASTPRSGSAR